MASLRDQIKAIIDFRTPTPSSDFFSQTDARALTAAETYAGLTPGNFTYPPGHGSSSTLNVFRFMTAAEIASVLAEDGLVDHTASIQRANDFLEGRTVSGTGGGPHVGGTLYFPCGLYNITGNLRVGGHVVWRGDEYYDTVLSWSTTAALPIALSLGPDNSGFFPGFTGLYSFGSALENFRISLSDQNQIAVVINSVGAAQFSYLRNVQIDGVNLIGVNLTGPGGPAYFEANQLDINGGARALGSREGIRISTGGGFVSLSEIAISGQAGFNFSIGVRVTDGQTLIHNIHTEQVTDGAFFDTGGTNATSLIQGWSGNATCTNLIHIPAAYTGTVTAIAINGLTGSAGQPIAIKNDVTGEAYIDFMSGIYSWSGNPGIRAGSFAASILHNTPHIRYGKSAVQAIAQNTLTLLSFPTQQDDWQAGGTTEWSGSRYTPKIPGRYRVTLSVALASTAWVVGAGGRFQIQIQRTGVAVSFLEDDSDVGTFTRQLTYSDTVLCAVGDYIETYVFQSVIASLNTDNNAFTCFIAIDRE